MERLLCGIEGPEAEEGFRWQVEAVRRHLRDLPADIPETAHLAGITEAVPAEPTATSGLRLGLTAYAYFLEHEGRIEEALDVLALAGRTHGRNVPPAEFTPLALFCARLNRILARWERASGSYRAAEEAALLVGDMTSLLRGKLGEGAVFRGQGNLPAARAMAERVIAETEPLDLRDVLTLAYADLGAVLEVQGLRVEALHANYRAFQLAPDELQQMRILGDIGVGLAELGRSEGARTAFEIVAASKASFLVRTNAFIELMDLESASGNRVAFERRRTTAEGLTARMTPSMMVDYRYKAGVGLARFGQLGRARDELMIAARQSEANRLHAWYFRVERVLQNLSLCPDHVMEPLVVPEVNGAPAIREVEVGLREFAELAGV